MHTVQDMYIVGIARTVDETPFNIATAYVTTYYMSAWRINMESEYPICCSGHDPAEMTKIDEYFEEGDTQQTLWVPRLQDACHTQVPSVS